MKKAIFFLTMLAFFGNMAQGQTNVPVSSLPAASTPLDNADFFPLIQSGHYHKATVADLLHQSWGINGNRGTNPGSNCLCTLDSVPIEISAGGPSMSGNPSLIYLQQNIGSSSGEMYLWQTSPYYNIQAYIDMNSEYSQLTTGNNNGDTAMHITQTPTQVIIASQQAQGLFEVDAAMKYNNGTQADGYNLVSDAMGNATWQDLSTRYLPLAGGTMNSGSHIYFGTGGQNIAQGSFDNGTGGNNGISLNCAIGYELNWQGGHLSNNASGTFYPVQIDSGVTVNGKLKIVDGTQSNGYVLTSDANGNASWQTNTGGGWGLIGNPFTNPATNFIGTTDDQRLNIKTNNSLRFSIGSAQKTIITYQDSFFALYRTPSLKATADAYQFMTASTFSWFDSVAADNVAYLVTGVDNFSYSTGDIFGVGNNYHSGIADTHYGNKKDVILSIDKTPHKRIQVEAYDNAVNDTTSGDAELSIYDPSAGHDVISIQLFKPHATGDIKTSFYDTVRANVIVKDEIGAGGIISEAYQNADSINYTGLKKIVFNNDIRVVNGSQGKNKIAISDNYGTLSWQTLVYLLSIVDSYSDDTAAASAGLNIGDTYYNTTTKAYTRRTI